MMKNKKKILSLILVTALFCSVVSGVHAAALQATSTDYRYEEKFLAAKLMYSDFALLAEETCPVPGLENTLVAEDSCSCMTPQGLCVTEDYILISAYCNIKKYKTELQEYSYMPVNADRLAAEENHRKHNSVIYIIDKKTGAYIKNIVLPDTNHVGGLASDGKNIYIAKSTDAQVSIIPVSVIEKAIATKSLSVAVEYTYTVDCGCTASFVTFYDNLLWVGVFDEENEGALNGFTVGEKDFTLTQVASVAIPAKANGACFADMNGELCLAVNTSYGRKSPSYIYLYSVHGYATDAMTLEKTGRSCVPPTVQNACIYDGRVYHIYESAATCYTCVDSVLSIKATSCAVDRVCIADADRLFIRHCEESVFVLKTESFFMNLFAYVREILLNMASC